MLLLDGGQTAVASSSLVWAHRDKFCVKRRRKKMHTKQKVKEKWEDATAAFIHSIVSLFSSSAVRYSRPGKKSVF